MMDLQVSELVTRTQTERYRGETNPEDFGYVNQRGLSRKHIFDSVQHSLKRLQLSYIDVLQCECRFVRDVLRSLISLQAIGLILIRLSRKPCVKVLTILTPGVFS